MASCDKKIARDWRVTKKVAPYGEKVNVIKVSVPPAQCYDITYCVLLSGASAGLQQ